MKAEVRKVVGFRAAWKGVVTGEEGTEVFTSRVYDEDVEGSEARAYALADAQNAKEELESRRPTRR